MEESIRNLLAVPSPSPIPRRNRWDYLLVAVLMALGVAEAIFGPDIAWRPAATVFAVAAPTLLLWRRSHPLATVVVAFGAQAALDIPAFLATDLTTAVGASVVVGITLTYAVCRWAPGHHAALGLLVILGNHTVTSVFDPDMGFLDGLFGTSLWLFPVAMAVAMRYRAHLADRRVVEARLAERHLLARELHDTVAHHVSAIAIQAQAGSALAEKRPEAAVDILRTVEEAASRALSDMRQMVSVLRSPDADVDLAPQSGLDALTDLAELNGQPPVEVTMRGDLQSLSPSVEASLFRLAQEGITNARRHARHATRISVVVEGLDDEIKLSISDDGDPPPTPQRATGFGLIGMAERIELLGGTFHAQPGRDRGWMIGAALPRSGVTA